MDAGEQFLRLRAVAIDDDGLQSAWEEILLSRGEAPAPGPAGGMGRLLGLCVGVSEYAEPVVQDLHYAHRDAEELARALSTQRNLYSGAEVDSLTNRQATREGIKSGLEKLIARATRADTAVILLSGHGFQSDDGLKFYFAAHEADPSRPDDTLLPWNEIVQRVVLLSGRSRRVIVLVDACHSGASSKTASNGDLAKALLDANTGATIISSSKGKEVSYEDPILKHGFFTKALLEAIEGQGAREGKVTLWDLMDYVKKRVKQMTDGRQNPDVPYLVDLDTDTPLFMQR
jgi:uncharacterized caspase-like protein